MTKASIEIRVLRDSPPYMYVVNTARECQKHNSMHTPCIVHLPCGVMSRMHEPVQKM